MQIEQMIDYLKRDSGFMANVGLWDYRPGQEARYEPLPQDMHPDLAAALGQMGIDRLYSHQRQTWDAVRQGRHPVITTPTASGKSLAYLLPILDSLLRRNHERSLLLFPTKALAQDQWKLLDKLSGQGNLEIKAFTYDGDTSPQARKSVRSAGQLVISNPDMLHAGIMPHHTQWVKLFENLSFVVIDELHTYKGVFGSHMANVLRRLRRLLRFYQNENVRFLMSSATIANPVELAGRITGQDNKKIELIQENGAPRGGMHVLLYNPPVVQKELGIRRSALREAAMIGSRILEAGVSAIYFVRSRVRVEVLANYLRQKAGPRRKDGVRAYRGGFLPNERRAIEKGLREGGLHTVVSTNALELGVDIGSLDVAVSVGFPGSIASLWQQFGRAGRRGRDSLVIMIATSSPLEQYFMREPQSLLQAPLERALVNPDNYLVEMAHLRCAAFEIPLEQKERFGSLEVPVIADYLASENILKKSGDRYYWANSVYPANEVSLRSASQENFVVVDQSDHSRILGEVDYYAAPTMIHEGAIYLHQGVSYFVDKLDWDLRQAQAKKVRADYYTDAEEKVDYQILSESESLSFAGDQERWQLSFGDIALHRQAVLYKKIKMYTHENVGWGRIHLPEIQMHTEASWITFADDWLASQLPQKLQGAVLSGLSYLMGRLAPGYLMCDQSDLRSLSFVRSPFSQKSSVLFYDTYPGGIALSKRLFHIIFELIAAAERVIAHCPCDDGCPSCIGPVEVLSQKMEGGDDPGKLKELARALLANMVAEPPVQGMEHSLEALNDFHVH
jgi:DEAD/DEAH box helicase domain-containing protein